MTTNNDNFKEQKGLNTMNYFNRKQTANNDFDYDIKERISTLSKSYGQTLELNLIKYGIFKPKFDLRRWESKQMHKGITLNYYEITKLKDELNKYLSDKTETEIFSEWEDY